VTDNHLRQRPAKYAAPEQILCRFDAIGDGTSKEVPLDNGRTSLCVVRKNETIYAYINSCPHTGSPLNWTGDQFLTRDGDMIQCSLHGALFRIADGLCVWGPCLHQRLTAVPTVIRGGAILLASEEGVPLGND
jgi:nitrite reductase/ring-hydroxylating ferredoxin subunit